MINMSAKFPPVEGASYKKSDPFVQSRLKLHQARLHAHKVSEFWHRTFDAYRQNVMGAEADPRDSLQDATLDIPIIPEIPLAIGDTLRNLRSSLDYLVSIMARSAGLSDSHTIFPFNEAKRSIEASFQEATRASQGRKAKKAGALYELNRKYPDLEEVILNKIKPYSAANGADPFGDMLWRVITSDNIDKHRLMTPTIHNVRDFNISTDNGTNIVGYGASITGTSLVFPPGTKFKNETNFKVDILFKEPTKLAGKPVVSTLIEGCHSVSQVIEIFSDKFGDSVKPGV